MLKLHDELIAELSNLLTAQNYNPVVVANNRLYARAFLDYLAECDLQVEAVTPRHCFMAVVLGEWQMRAE